MNRRVPAVYRREKGRAAVLRLGLAILGRPSRPKKKGEGTGRACRRAGPEGGEQAEWARNQESEGFPFFFLFFKLLNPFSNRFEFLLNFWIKANHHNKKYAPA